MPAPSAVTLTSGVESSVSINGATEAVWFEITAPGGGWVMSDAIFSITGGYPSYFGSGFFTGEGEPFGAYDDYQQYVYLKPGAVHYFVVYGETMTGSAVLSGDFTISNLAPLQVNPLDTGVSVEATITFGVDAETETTGDAVARYDFAGARLTRVEGYRSGLAVPNVSVNFTSMAGIPDISEYIVTDYADNDEGIFLTGDGRLNVSFSAG